MNQFFLRENQNRSMDKEVLIVKLVTVEFFLNNERHKTTRENFMGCGFDCENALFLP